MRWQHWPIGEGTRLPPMWPGFDFCTRCHMLIECVGFLLCHERFLRGYSGFPLSSKTNIWFDLWIIIVNKDLGNVDLISSRIVKRIWSYSYANLRYRNIKHYYYYYYNKLDDFCLKFLNLPLDPPKLTLKTPKYWLEKATFSYYYSEIHFRIHCELSYNDGP